MFSKYTEKSLSVAAKTRKRRFAYTPRRQKKKKKVPQFAKIGGKISGFLREECDIRYALRLSVARADGFFSA